MKRILYVQPPRWHEMIYPGVAVTGKSSILQPLGLLFVAATVDKYCETQSRLFDFNLHDDSAPDYGVIDRELLTFRPDIVGITSYTHIMYDVYQVAKRVKSLLPDALIVLGGKHTECYPRETVAQSFIDYIVVGEGEYAMRDLVQSLERGEREPVIPGVWFQRADGTIHDGGMASSIKELDELAVPDLSLVDPAKRHLYGYKFGGSALEAMMYTSRGCPWKCTYCLSAYSDHKVYFHSPESVLATLERYVRDGYSVIHFMDDHFNVNIKRAKQICRMIIERNIKIRWTMRGSTKYVDDELAELLQKSGCERVNLGIESADVGILASFDRFVTEESLHKAFTCLAGRGIGLSGYFILGWPEEDRAGAQRSIDLAKSLPLDFAQFTPLSPAPGTPHLHRVLRDGLLPRDPYLDYTVSPTKEFLFPYVPGKLSEAELTEVLKDAYQQFYLRPSLILRHASRLRSPRELLNKAILGAQIVAFSGKRLLARRPA